MKHFLARAAAIIPCTTVLAVAHLPLWQLAVAWISIAAYGFLAIDYGMRRQRERRPAPQVPAEPTYAFRLDNEATPQAVADALRKALRQGRLP